MSHLLIVELPGGNDGDILAAALAEGHRFTFLTADPAHYLGQADLVPMFERAEAILDAGDFEISRLLALLQSAHAADPFEALLCLQDLRIVEAADLASGLGLRHLNPETARLCRNKASVRAHLAHTGIAQPPFAVARDAAELVAAATAIGLPCLIKPADGFGSQNIFGIRSATDLAMLRERPDIIAHGSEGYGLGVASSGTLLVERLLEGQIIGCDTMTVAGQHMLLGVNEKIFFPPPSFAIRGGCFTTNCGQFADIETFVFCLLNAIEFDFGATHIELMLTDSGPQLIEINPRLVGARIGRLISAARGRSVHADIIDLHHAGQLPPASQEPTHAATRWLAAPTTGVLESISLPSVSTPQFAGITLGVSPGQVITPPFDNADRLGCVMTCGIDRAATEALAEEIVANTRISVAGA